MNVYGSPELERRFRAAWRKSKKKLDMGKSCLRFQIADELALDAIADAVASTPVKAFIARYEAARG
jgi:DNA-binding transcriptional regulator PaaX